MELLNGNEVSKKIKLEIKAKVDAIRAAGKKAPHLAAILVGSDGATHQGAFDHSFLRCIPNMHVLAPADEDECRQMLHTAVALGRPAAVRYPRGRGPGVAVQSVRWWLPPNGSAKNSTPPS